MEVALSLQHVSLFEGLPKHHIELLTKVSHTRSFAPGEVIVRQGERGIGLYLISSGEVEVVREEGGLEEHWAIMRPGDVFGELALLTHHPRTATVRAVGPTDCLVLTEWNFRAAIEENPIIADRLLKRVAEWLVADEERASIRLPSQDSLTGLANRRFFESALNQEWRRAIRLEKPLSLLVVEVDAFPEPTDQRGRERCNDCLRQVAQTVSSALRRPGDLVGRYGSNRLIALLPETDAAGREHVAERLHKETAAADIPHPTASRLVTLNIGSASELPLRGSVPAGLVEAAEKALHVAKAQGG